MKRLSLVLIISAYTTLRQIVQRIPEKLGSLQGLSACGCQKQAF
jgi:hypothetical protein